ncbi:hypothetical protein [Clostridium thermobutyricum]|uniref:Uncharacterized protein n=1 Tax=Clostridium thermobutyricum DSM 4928 TaxID=1121339 RepID=A0A1V4SW72_9CLOT|nr:hypothetical protein [Clostridium thermobutyricum]OPX47857.1 hypothetical protein CLTHE_14280 [Clostridium thermobutyricum DSM 4928]
MNKWKCENYFMYLELLVKYINLRKNAIKNKEDIAKILCSLRNGYRPLNLTRYL